MNWSKRISTLIHELNPRLNAFVQVDVEGARRQARAAEAAVSNGEELGALHGVPLSIKSSMEVAGLRWEAGTKLRAGIVAERDAPLVARLRQAGAIILGVTNAPELLMAWETDNLLYGRTNSPWDVTRTPGGSSGGEAAAIAAGMSAGGVGSDGGGSIREPAHFCGICGLKPTPGRIPATGHFPESVGPFALLGVVGPMARNMEDLKILFEVMQGPDDGDPSAAPVPLRWPDTDELKRSALAISRMTDARRSLRKRAPRCEPQRKPCGARAFRWILSGRKGSSMPRKLWWQLFGIAGGMMLGPMIKGREAELSPILKEFSAGWRLHALLIPGSPCWIPGSQRDVVRMQIFAQMREYPVLALSGGFDSRLPAWRAPLAG